MAAEPQGTGKTRTPRTTPIGLALDVLEAMDILKDAVCSHSSLPREIAEKCEQVCQSLKNKAFELIRYYSSYRRGEKRWRKSYRRF